MTSNNLKKYAADWNFLRDFFELFINSTCRFYAASWSSIRQNKIGVPCPLTIIARQAKSTARVLKKKNGLGLFFYFLFIQELRFWSYYLLLNQINESIAWIFVAKSHVATNCLVIVAETSSLSILKLSSKIFRNRKKIWMNWKFSIFVALG